MVIIKIQLNKMADTIIVGRVANRGCTPNLDSEGEFLKPLVKFRCKGVNWAANLTAFERLNAHQTLASSRRFVHFRPFPGTIPKDELDFILSAHYDHSTETFSDKVDLYIQPESVNTTGTWKRLRNTFDIRESKRTTFGPN